MRQLPSMPRWILRQLSYDDPLLGLRRGDVSGERRGDVVLNLPCGDEFILRGELLCQLRCRDICWKWCRAMLDMPAGFIFTNDGDGLLKLRCRQIFCFGLKPVFFTMRSRNISCGVAKRMLPLSRRLVFLGFWFNGLFNM